MNTRLGDTLMVSSLEDENRALRAKLNEAIEVIKRCNDMVQDLEMNPLCEDFLETVSTHKKVELKSDPYIMRNTLSDL